MAGKTFSEIKNLFEEIWKSFYFGNLCKFHLDAYMIFFSLKRKRNKKLPKFNQNLKFFKKVMNIFFIFSKTKIQIFLIKKNPKNIFNKSCSHFSFP